MFAASFAGGVYALDQERGAPVWKNEKATGVTELTLWKERAHAPRKGSADYVRGGPPSPARELLARVERHDRPLGARPGERQDALAHPAPRGRRDGAGRLSGALLDGHDEVRRVPAFAASTAGPSTGSTSGSGFSQAPAAYGSRAYLLTNEGTLVGIQIESAVRAVTRQGRRDAP